MRVLLFISILTSLYNISRGEEGEGEDNEFFGNLAFFGRGQRRLPKYWCDIKDIVVSKKTKAYFPYYKYDNDPSENSSSNDPAMNYPLSIFLSGRDEENEYSEIRFELDRTDFNNFNNFSYLKSEMKIRIPKAKSFIDEGYTCEDLGISCTNIEEYDFSKNLNEWLKLIDFRIYFEDPDISKSKDYTKDEIKNLSFQLDTFESPTTEWKEIVAEIKNLNKDLKYTSLIFRNYGKMPFFLSVGNTKFLKSEKDDTVIIKNGIFNEEFEDWSWYSEDNDEGKDITVFYNRTCPDDPEQKNGIYYSTKESFNFACKVMLKKNFTAPPEAISFKYRPMKESKLNLSFNEKLTLSINEYLVARNCKTIVGEEATILIDMNYYSLTDAKLLLDNDVDRIWIQTVTNIENMKAQVYDITKNETLRDEYVDDLYLYDITFHHKYPTNLEPYNLKRLYSTGQCDVSSHTQSSITSSKRRWPDEITFEKMYSSENVVFYSEKKEISDDLLNKENSANLLTITANCFFFIFISILYFILI